MTAFISPLKKNLQLRFSHHAEVGFDIFQRGRWNNWIIARKARQSFLSLPWFFFTGNLFNFMSKLWPSWKEKKCESKIWIFIKNLFLEWISGAAEKFFKNVFLKIKIKRPLHQCKDLRLSLGITSWVLSPKLSQRSNKNVSHQLIYSV